MSPATVKDIAEQILDIVEPHHRFYACRCRTLGVGAADAPWGQPLFLPRCDAAIALMQRKGLSLEDFAVCGLDIQWKIAMILSIHLEGKFKRASLPRPVSPVPVDLVERLRARFEWGASVDASPGYDNA